MSAAPDSENNQPADNRETVEAPAESLLPERGKASDTGSTADSEASGGGGSPVHAGLSFADQDAQKRPGDGPNARD